MSLPVVAVMADSNFRTQRIARFGLYLTIKGSHLMVHLSDCCVMKTREPECGISFMDGHHSDVLTVLKESV